MVDLPAFVAANAVTFVLVLCRVGGLFVLAPVFASRLVPMRIRLGMALAISLVALPHADGHATGLDPIMLAPLVLKELLLGSALAFGVAGVYAAVELAGSLIDSTIGFSLANVVDPALNFQSTAIAQLYGMLASLIFLGSGAHLVMIGGLVRSFDVLPVDRMPAIPALSGLAVHALAPLFTIGLEIAAPVVATLFVTDVAFGFLARLVPQLQPMAVQFSVKILAGLGVMGLALPITLRLIEGRFTDALSVSGFLPGIGP